jgi:hypothetical protein
MVLEYVSLRQLAGVCLKQAPIFWWGFAGSLTLSGRVI